MKKTLLIAAAALAAGVISTQAQPVYSQNIVGYYNLSVPAGKTALIAIQLSDGSGHYAVNTQLTNGIADQSNLLIPTGPGSFASLVYYAGYGWYDQNNNLATNELPAGTSAYLINGDTTSSNTFAIIGNVPTNSPVVVSSGYGFYSQGGPLAVSIDSTNSAFPSQNNDNYLHWNVVDNTYDASYVYYDGYGWYDQNNVQAYPTPNVGEGFLYFNSGASTNWDYNFSVQ